MIEPLLLGGLARLLVEIYQRFFRHEPCEHKKQMTQHSNGYNLCYDCGEKIYKQSDYPNHQR